MVFNQFMNVGFLKSAVIIVWRCMQWPMT